MICGNADNLVMGGELSDNANSNHHYKEAIGGQGTSRKNEDNLCQSDQKSFKTSNHNHKTIHSSSTNPKHFSDNSSERIEIKESNFQLIMQKRSSRDNGSIIRNCREDQTTQGSSCSKRLYSASEMFAFWELKQSERTQNISNLNVSQNSNFSGRVQSIKLTKKSFDQDHVIQKDFRPQASGSNIDEDEVNEEQRTYTRTVTMQRTRKRDLFSDSRIFFQIDRHVLRVSQKIKSDSELSVQQIVHQILNVAQTELEKIRAIWIWLCNNIEYDVSGYLGFSKKMHTPQQVLQSGKGVCSGYSSLCQEMCRQAGITCTEVSGHGKGIGYNLGQSYQHKKSSHMWNAVQVDKQWYLLDACWAAGVVDMERGVFIQRYDDHYFLADPEEFIESHWPDDPKWQLMDSVISLEDFEQQVFKTSAFYRLGLSLVSPKKFLLQTVNGEAAVSLGSAHTVEFSYSITELGKSHLGNIDTSCGIMRVTPNGMELRVIPPSRGKYDLKIFGKPLDSKESYTWICSYQVDCPVTKVHERLPANPFTFWGLHWSAKCVGISSCSCSEGFINAPDGCALLHFQTSRPLSATYKLIHGDLDNDVTKRCIVSQIGEGKLVCKVALLAKGYCRLSVFVKPYYRESSYQNICNCLIDCPNPVNQNELFPENLSNHCGPGIRTKEIGFSKASHPEPVINTPHGKCNITFQTAKDVEVTAKLTRDEASTEDCPLQRHTLCTHTKNKVSIGVSLPASGVYKLGIFVRPEDEEDFGHVCDYVIRCYAESQWPPFPQTYNMWKKGCVLFEPKSGVLPSDKWVRFRVHIPGAHRVFLIGESMNELHLSKSRVWEGNVFTGSAGSQLKLSAKLD
ncbi:kyphoscoliosis peptidase [Carcharodon carcharias]|uniref:kyphoscoliosis peptidase n=1 Tax=Carcharodon carcharias TaxID=13397 RepID=UPI001B7DAADA|nr:kyphoscoliosis peptidase [Carcharodon carcharias]